MSSEEQKWVFIEAWVDAGLSTTPYVLLLVCRNDSTYEVVDPREEYKTIFSHSSYREVTFWLGEDEYERVIGRVDNEALK